MSVCSSNFSELEILSYLEKEGKLNLRDVRDEMTKREKEKIVAKHPYAISCGKDGRWRTYVSDPSVKTGRRMIVKSSYEKVVDALYEEAKAAEMKDVSLEELYDQWHAHKALSVEPTTILIDDTDWKTYYVKEPIVKKPIRLISKLDCEEWLYSQLGGKKRKNKHQYGRITTIMRQMLLYAVDLGIIEKSPFERINFDKSRYLAREVKPKDETQVFYKEELETVSNLAWEDFESGKRKCNQLAPLALLMMFQTGCRLSEVSALRYEDIDKKKEVIRFRRMVQYRTARVVPYTKGAEGDREVFLTEEASKIVKTAKEYQETHNLPSDEFIFRTSDSTLSSLYKAIERCFRKYCELANIPQKSSHKARKTVASKLLNNGMSVNTVRQILGHRDERTTFNNYIFDVNDDKTKRQQFKDALKV